MSTVEQKIEGLLANNKKFQKSDLGLPEFLQIRGDTNAQPRIVIVSCSDPRIIPEKYFGFDLGGPPVIRTAGARAKDAIGSLGFFEHALKLGAVLIVHHTDCGLSHETNDSVRKGLKANAPDHGSEIDALDFGEITGADFDASLKHDVELVRNLPWIRKKTIVKGYLYNTKTGAITEKVSA